MPATISGTNLAHARSHNRRVVIEAVRAGGPASCADIARATSLTPQTVSNIVRELKAAGLLTATGRRRSARGQPALPYDLNPVGGFSIGFELDHQALLGILVDLAGRPLAETTLAVDRPGPEVAIPLIRAAVSRLVRAARIDRRRLLGIGIAMPGPFGVEGMTSVGPTSLPGWENVSLADALGSRVGLPVIVENDATAAAIGERLYGVARAISDFVYLFIGTGLGAGLFLGGRIHGGDARNAGEIGHMIVAPRGRPCPCGNRGCLERYVSLRAAYEWLDLDDPDHATPDRLARLAETHDRSLALWVKDAARHLKTAVNAIESLLDPQTIILGGFLPQALIERLIASIGPLHASVGASRQRRYPRLMIGAAGPRTVALGAAALPIFDEFNPRFEVLLKS